MSGYRNPAQIAEDKSANGIKEFNEQKYPVAITVLVTNKYGSWLDGIKGLNKGHAMFLARANWVDAQIDYVGVYIDEYI